MLSEMKLVSVMYFKGADVIYLLVCSLPGTPDHRGAPEEDLDPAPPFIFIRPDDAWPLALVWLPGKPAG